VPLDIPKKKVDTYKKNLEKITWGTGRLMLMAGDQKVEHLNKDFYGEGIPIDDADPEHLFRIASQARIGVFATQLGLIARYGMNYKKIPYLIKLNAKSNLVKSEQRDPVSLQFNTVDQVVAFQKNSGLQIYGVGYTLYLGSEFESQMLTEAAQMIYEAHQHGLITVLWSYPRGKAVKNEKDPHIIAGATGVGVCLGADFVKINYPVVEGQNSAELLKEAVLAAGRAKVICAGGPETDVKTFLQTLHEQIHISGAGGSATGRNIHQRPLAQAIAFTNAIFAVTCQDATVDQAYENIQRTDESG
jgi:fructose-bisphosphate aldolase/6-deoxy-5-ketofructose 1-phosphate synthase